MRCESTSGQLPAPLDEGGANRFDAALVGGIGFEREFSKLDTDAQTILLLAFREHQPQRMIAQISRWSEHAVFYKPLPPLPDLRTCPIAPACTERS